MSTVSDSDSVAASPGNDRRAADDIPSVGAFRLTVGLLSGLALYWLEHARATHAWPATAPFFAVPLTSLVSLIPIFLLQAVGRMTRRTLVLWIVGAAAIVAGLAWYDVWRRSSFQLALFDASSPTAAFMFFVYVALFIAQSLITAGDADKSFLTRYRNYFDATWKFGLQLALSGAFVLALWALLYLGAELFALIKLDFFRKIIQHDWFYLPATTVATAAAMQLTDVRTQLVSGVRAVGLTLLSWLLPLMTAVTALFVASLAFTGLQPLWDTRWATRILLSAAAALVVLINAAYQDGEEAGARPLVLRYGELIASVLLVPLVILASFALALRVQQYGWTIDRIATLACILVAACYALGYTAAALFSLLGGQWMWALESVNVFVAFLILLLVFLLFSPISDPARLSVASQMARLESGATKPAAFDFAYLRAEGGRFGEAALQRLASWRSGSGAPAIRAAAAAALKGPIPVAPFRVSPAKPSDLETRISVYPAGRKLPESFLKEDWTNAWKSGGYLTSPCFVMDSAKCNAFFADLTGDGKEDIILTYGFGDSWSGTVFAERPDGTWTSVASIPVPRCPGTLDAMKRGAFKPIAPLGAIDDLEIAGRRVHVVAVPQTDSTPCPK